MIQFNLDTVEASQAVTPFSVSVIGIGGSGTNVIDKMALEGVSGVDLVSLNCDARALNTSMAGTKLQLGKTLTQGLGCGGDPELGAEAATASGDEIRQLLAGRNMVFLCVGLGGGTGSGAAPVIARMAREAGAFVIVFATLPFAFEGRRRSNQASIALQDLRKYANALITFENDRMGELVVPKKGVQEAFELADKIIGQSVRAVTSLVTQPGLIHIGMDDLVTALQNTDSRCLFGFGQAKGENRAVEALSIALKSPLLDRGQMLSGARNVLVHVCGSTNLTLFEIETLMRDLGKHVHEDAQILFGAATDARLGEHLSVTILTSLNKPVPAVAVPVEAKAELPPAPVVEAAAAAAVAPPIAVTPSPVPVAAAPAVPAAVVPVSVPAAPVVAAVQEAPPAPIAVAVAVAAAARPAPIIVEEELFPETVAQPEAQVVLVQAPAAVVAARPVFAPPVAAVVPVIVETAPEPEPEYYAEPEPEVAGFVEELEESAAYNYYEAGETAEPAAEFAAPEAAYEVEEEYEEEIVADLPPEPEPEPEPAPLPERVLRIERKPAATPRAAVAPARAEAAPPKRFVLSDIIKRETRRAPEPVMDYDAEEEDMPAAPSPPPRPAPVSRRAPDYDRVTPIRPIPAGRNAAPVPSPFTQAKAAAPAPAPIPPRAVPTQQQTFDERLQPASNGGRFERAKPTVEEGEDLDVPTFLRRKR